MIYVDANSGGILFNGTAQVVASQSAPRVGDDHGGNDHDSDNRGGDDDDGDDHSGHGSDD